MHLIRENRRASLFTLNMKRSIEESAKRSWTRSEIWIKELLGLPTYCAATLALLKVTHAVNPILLIVGLLSFITAYNVWYEYLFPDHKLHAHWLKIALLLIGQIVFGSFILMFAFWL